MGIDSLERELFRIEQEADRANRIALRIAGIDGTEEAFRKLCDAAFLLDQQADQIREALNLRTKQEN